MSFVTLGQIGNLTYIIACTLDTPWPDTLASIVDGLSRHVRGGSHPFLSEPLMRPSRLASLGLVVAALCLFLGRLSAQQLIDEGQIKQFHEKMQFPFTQKTLTGLETPAPQLLEQAARFYVQRVTFIPILADPKKMKEEVFQDFDNMISI